MTIQTKENNPILRYAAEIESGGIVVSRKVHKVYARLADRVLHPDRYYYNPERAQHVIVFFEKYLRHAKGKLGGQLVKLELWQKAFFAAGFGFVDIEEIRQFQRMILLVGKKNGKSLMSSGVGLYALTADNEPGAEVYSAATTRDQAKIIWSTSKSMRNKSPALRKRIRSTVSGLYFDEMDAEFRPLAANHDNLDGLNVHCALMDEIHQWKNGRALYDVIADGVSAREQPLILLTSTAGTVRDDIYDEIYAECEQIINGYEDPDIYQDERTLPVIYELDDRSEWTDPAMWGKANPNLGVSKKSDYLEEKVNKLKSRPNIKMQRDLLTKEFNIPETSATTWMSYEEIHNPSRFEWKDDGFAVIDEAGVETIQEAPNYGVGGFDLSVRGDLTAAVVLFQLPDDPTIYCEPMFWMPSDVLDEHIASDKIPYDLYQEEGILRICPGNQIDYRMVADWFREIRDKRDIYLPWIGYDPAYSAYLVEELKLEFGEQALLPVRQGFITLGMPMATIEKKFKAGQVNYNANKLMKFNLLCVSVEEDRNGNLMPSKRRRNLQRIDGFSAMVTAWAVMQQHNEQYQALI